MRSLLFASILIVFTAVSAPELITRYLDRPVAAAASEQSLSETALAPSAGGATQFMIEAESDGHFYVDAEMNLRKVRLLVDTGATVTALRESDANSVGIRLSPGDYTQPVMTANGATYAAETRIDSVVIDNIEVSGVRVFVLPDEQLSISLLGGSFLNKLSRFEVADGTLIFEN